MTEDAKPSPWERQPNEPDDAFRHFILYRDMPVPRRIDRRAHLHITKLLEWYKDWNWKTRVSAYDDHLSAFAIEEYEAVIAQTATDAAVQHIALLNDAKEIAAIETRKWLRHAQSTSPDAPSLLKMGDLTKLIESAIKLDRLVRGETTEEVGLQTELTNLTDEELRQLEELERKANGL